MAVSGSQAGLELFDGLNIEYEKAYQNNPFKIACIKKAISLLDAGSRVLDVGCGTGIPVSEMLSKAGLEVTGCDIAPKMIELAQTRVRGNFIISDMLEYEPDGEFAAVFIIFSHLQLSYADFHAAVYKFAKALQADGLLVIGQMPSDTHVRDPADYDESKSYVEDYNAPFMGEPLPTFMMSTEGQLNFLRSMGFEIISNTIDFFQPDNPKCDPEQQQYVIAKRPNDQPLEQPRPLPRV